MNECAGLGVKNTVCAAPRMNRIKAVARHFGNIIGKHTGRVDNYLRSDCSAVCFDGNNLSVFRLH